MTSEICRPTVNWKHREHRPSHQCQRQYRQKTLTYVHTQWRDFIMLYCPNDGDKSQQGSRAYQHHLTHCLVKNRIQFRVFLLGNQT